MLRFLLFLLLSAVPAFGTTYYIDFVGGADTNNGTAKGTAWKRRPGMTGAAMTYSHSAGDIFIYKGGVSWTSSCWPLVLPASGSAGNIDTDTTDHTWFTGGVFSQPAFDGGGLYTAGGIVQAISRQYFLINDINVVNVGIAGAADPRGSHGFAFVFDSCQHWTVQNCVTAHEGEVLMYVNETSGASGTYTDINILNNDVSHSASIVWMTTAGAGYFLSNVNIKGNHLHDGSSQICHNIHSDGIAHFFSSPNHSATQTIQSLDISGNVVDGNWTKVDATAAGVSAFIFNEMFLSGKIYNNSFTVKPLVVGQVPVWLYINAEAGMAVEYYNNSIDSSAIASSGIGIYSDTISSTGTMIVRNNLVAGTQYAFANAACTGTLLSDYNVFNSTSANLQFNGSFQSYATWIAAGRDTHGTLGTAPLFVTPGVDLHLKVGSVGIGTAVNLSSIFTTDQTGATRVAPWDAGAYAFTSGGGGGGPGTFIRTNTVKSRLIQ